MWLRGKTININTTTVFLNGSILEYLWLSVRNDSNKKAQIHTESVHTAHRDDVMLTKACKDVGQSPFYTLTLTSLMLIHTLDKVYTTLTHSY